MILNGVVAVGHNDDTDSDSAAWQRVVERSSQCSMLESISLL